jgi:hypothetical protein
MLLFVVVKVFLFTHRWLDCWSELHITNTYNYNIYIWTTIMTELTFLIENHMLESQYIFLQFVIYFITVHFIYKTDVNSKWHLTSIQLKM